MSPPQRIQHIVVKVGASVLSDAAGRPDERRLAELVRQLAECRAQGRRVVLVSSGAIACGMAQLRLKRRPASLAQLQACAAVGQGRLMELYSAAAARQGITVAQVLLTQADLADRVRCRNAKQTLRALLDHAVLPIINENDAVAVEEIAFGDNDRLAALVGCVLEADLVVLLSDVDGLLHEGRVIERIDRLDASHHAMVLGPSRETTTGGMAAKLAAARITRHGGIPLIIANGTAPGILQDVLGGKPVGTLVAPPATKLKFRKWWAAFAVRTPRGTIVVDAGASEALRHRGTSLLPVGVAAVEGAFKPGDPVAIVDVQRAEIARGITNFSSRELQLIRGLSSRKIVDVLGRASAEEVVHRDHLVLTQELNA